MKNLKIYLVLFHIAYEGSETEVVTTDKKEANKRYLGLRLTYGGTWATMSTWVNGVCVEENERHEKDRRK